MLGLDCFFQFLDPLTQPVELAGRGPVRHKASSYTQDNMNTEKTQTNIHASSVILTHDLGVWTGECDSCLGPLGHCDRQELNFPYLTEYPSSVKSMKKLYYEQC
jgi:hypothetical protein